MDVRDLQGRLLARGFDPGPLDGVMGLATYQALASFTSGRAAPADVGAALAKHLPAGALNTRLRIIHFMAQVCHESSFQAKAENLNYSAARLMQVWPRRFPTLELAQTCAKNPQALAETVYRGRMGNDQPGDGWRYRGRGWLQITGRENYVALGCADEPDELLTSDGAARAAVAYWVQNGLNALADNDDTSGVSRRINGGSVGLADRALIVGKIKAVWP